MVDAVEPPSRRIKTLVLGLAFAGFFGLSLARWLHFNNQTFDLAFYARMAWGMVRLDFWDPILDAHHAGLHLSPVLAPIGLLGLAMGTVPALLATQSLACVLAAERLGAMGLRHLGARGWWVGALALVLHPNLGHVATYEAHPGTLALFPLALAIERLDARSSRGFAWACVSVLLCREDMGLMTALLGVLAWRAGLKRVGLGVAIGSLLYVALFVAVLHPMLAPEQGSFAAHFGPWGDGFGGMLATWFGDPMRLMSHLVEPRRLLYVLVVFGPLAFLPLGAVRWLLPALPVFAMNLLSHFPTTVNLDSHYTTPALPFLVAATVVTLKRFETKRAPVVVLGVALVGTSVAFGVRPSAHLEWGEMQRAAERIVDAIPDGASVQAPDRMLAHLAERERLHRAPPPDRNADWVVLDLGHRERYRHREDLLRTQQEPGVRTWLARRDYGVVLHAAPWVLMQRGADSRELLEPATFGGDATRLCDCLSVGNIERIDDERVALTLVAHGACPNDLALRINDHVELLFDGVVSPIHLRAGDVMRSIHHHSRGELRVGALRSSGAPPSPTDPRQVNLGDK